VNWNGARWKPGDAGGHYESWFMRANDDADRAFWIRYTIFSPIDHPERAVGELWAIWFERDKPISAVKSELPIAQCSFAPDRLAVTIGDATLDATTLKGSAAAGGHSIAWDLQFGEGGTPILLMPERLYDYKIPRAKMLVGRPLARYSGAITVDGKRFEVSSWLGSQNHNWGSRHTDRYAWGQVCGFDDRPDVFLECGTGRLKLGPVWTPPMSPVVLKIGDEILSWTNITRTLRALGAYAPYQWHLETTSKDGTIDIRMDAEPSEFVALKYPNPPGGTKICLNSKIARCEVTLQRPDKPTLVLRTQRAAFEILDDTAPPGVIPSV
jgi:hypothetical protein